MVVCNRCKGTGYEKTSPGARAVVKCKGCGGSGKIKPRPNAPIVYSKEFSKWLREESRNTKITYDNRGWGRRQ